MSSKRFDIKQEGGSHYEFEIEPIEYIEKNKLSFSEGNVIKYVTRYKVKNGVEDLKKARTYLDYLIKREEGFDKLKTEL